MTRLSLVPLATVLLTLSCSSPVLPPAVVKPPPPEPTVYLPKERANGWPYCFDPDSAALRRFETRPRVAPTDRLDAAALALDVRDLHAAMEHLYAGYPELLHSTKFDVDVFFADWEREVRTAGESIDFQRGVLAPAIALRRQVRDNHLGLWGYQLAKEPALAYSEYQRVGHFTDPALCTAEGVGAVPGTLRNSVLVSRDSLQPLATFSAQSTAPMINVHCEDAPGAIPFERLLPDPDLGVKLHDDGPPYEWHKVGRAVVIRLKHLHASKANEANLEQLAQDYDAQRAAPVIVFDFRGTAGGSDGYVGSWIRKAARGTSAPAFVDVTSSSAVACGDWNSLVEQQIADKTIDTDEGRAAREAFLASHPLGGGPKGASGDVFDGASSPFTSKTPYRGRIFVLVDRYSGSSGESAPLELQAALGAMIVGERTAGYLEYGNMRPYLMPRTGIGWQLGSKRNLFVYPSDGVGIAVDAYLSPDLVEAPVETLLPYLLKLPKPGAKPAVP
jgi:hypothetical protein